jgi:hypothetical protein
MEENELFGEAHEQEENGLFGRIHQAEQLNLCGVVVPKGTFYCWDGAVGEQVCEKQCVDCKNENEGKLQQ